MCCGSTGAGVVHNGTHTLVSVVMPPKCNINFVFLKGEHCVAAYTCMQYSEKVVLSYTCKRGSMCSISRRDTGISPEGSVSFVLSTYIGLKVKTGNTVSYLAINL